MSEGRSRVRSRQGEGAQLRTDILAAAGRILAESGSEDALTLRAIARAAGITAPAIYAHFTDRDAIKLAVIEGAFAELAGRLQAGADAHDDPVPRLRAVCRAYLDFAADHPHHYRLLFQRHRIAVGAAAGAQAPDVQSIVGADAFGVLLNAVAACIAAGDTSGDDPVATTTRVWIGLHGQATLQASLPWFPWPDRDELAESVLTRLADLADLTT